MKATVRLDIDRRAGEIDRRIFGGFLEHLGRAVYGGVYDPGSPLSDADGFRADVAESLRALDMPCVRYPGGNFVSNYDWRDGVGPVERRPSRPDFAWKSIEPNTFGVDEFVRWCRRTGTEPMMAVNLGTLGPREAADLVEYCNLEGGTHWSDARRANGSADPHAGTSQDLEVEISFGERRAGTAVEVDVLSGDDPKAHNSWERPDEVTPVRGRASRGDDGKLRVRAPALGFTVVRARLERPGVS